MEPLDMKPQPLANQPRSEFKANDVLTLKTLTAELSTQKIGGGERLSQDDQQLIVEMALGAGSAIPPGGDVPMPNAPKSKIVIENAPTELVLPQQQVAHRYEDKNAEGIIEITGPAPTATTAESSSNSQILPGSETLQSGGVAKQQIRIIFTGRSGAGKSYLADMAGLQAIELDLQIFSYLKQTFPNASEADLSQAAAKIRWWGEGVISNAVPVTIERLLFSRQVDAPGFGEPGYWVKRLVDGLSDGRPAVVVTQVETTSDLKALQAAGFKHYHVMVSNSTLQQRQKRPNADDRLANALDQDVTRKLSQARQGDRLKCIWSDERSVIPNAQRLYSVSDFVNAVNAVKNR